LAKQAPAEEIVNTRRDALGVDQLGDLVQLVGIFEAHALLNGPPKLEKALANLFGGQFIDRSQATIAQMIDVVDRPLARTQLENVRKGVKHVFRTERHHVQRHVLMKLAVVAEAPDPAQPVAVLVVKFLLEERPGLFNLRRIARPQPGINPQQPGFIAVGCVLCQRVENQRIADLLDDLDLLHLRRDDLRQRLSDLASGGDQLLPAVGINDRVDDVGLRSQRIGGHRLGLVELPDDLRIGAEPLVHRPQEGRSRYLGRLVDADGQ